ncbi:hypothetical protein [Streptomyces sp. NPDC008001]|uniref:hypothetical protein n=1 Tax=Streptomyces sp. NPDC008001 TaxID=3364804 RepID=UPI0036E720D1
MNPQPAALDPQLVQDAFRLHSPVPAEQVVLGTYTFLPHHRTGIAAALGTPFTTAAPARGRAALRMPVQSPGGEDAVEVTLEVRGPGDVTGLDPRQIIRRWPVPGTADADPTEFAHIEFDAPDLPWMFTPAAPDGDGHLPPWLRLIVVEAQHATLHLPAQGGLAQLSVPRTELPAAPDAWAWAHVQVLGEAAGTPGLADRLAPTSPETSLSRLIAPRRLLPHCDWIACVVPTFAAGARAGLGAGGPADQDTLAWSWGTEDTVVLPVYDHWTFSTGEDVNFETLAGRLYPVEPPGTVGVREVDTSRPGNGIPGLPPGAAGRTRSVKGALTRVGAPPDDAAWPAATTQALRLQLEAPDRHRHTGSEPAGRGKEPPAVAPPLYAGAHTGRARVDDTAPAWFRGLNLDPADRLVAGLGTRVVQMDQEPLMASAWAQIEGVEATNRQLRAAQLGRYLSESLHRSHLARMSPAALLAVTERATSRLLHAPGQTVRAYLQGSVLPVAAAAGTLRRLARPRGPLARFVRPEAQRPAGEARVRAVEGLLADGTGNVRDWVRRYADPDAVTALAGATVGLLPKECRQPVTDAMNGLSRVPAPEALRDAALDGSLAGRVAGFVQQIPPRSLSDALETLLAALPTPEDCAHDQEVAEYLTDLVPQVRAVTDESHQRGITDWTVRRATAERLSLSEPLTEASPLVRLHAADVRNLLATYQGIAERWGISLSSEADAGLARRLRGLAEVTADDLARDLGDLAGVLVPAGGPRDTERTARTVADLDLLALLHPARTVTRRVLARLPEREQWPPWLPADWFDDNRAEQVRAAPRFPHAMYEALDRYDRSWLMPGVEAIEQTDMVTLLQTNARFVEAFLIGLNTEFARELVWRGYPTDGRATSFRSFWTPADELQNPVHALGEGALGSHLDPRLDGAVVLLVRGELVRRFPNLLAHAVQQTDGADPPQNFALTPATTLFRLNLDPDLLLVGFQETAADMTAPATGVGAWWFTLSEHVGQPRFGLDKGLGEGPDEGTAHPAGTLVKRDDLRWGDLAYDGQMLRATTPLVDLQPPFRADAAYIAWLLFQQPARAAFSAADMIGKLS